MNNNIFYEEYLPAETRPTEGISEQKDEKIEEINLIISEPLAKPRRKIIKAQVISE